MEICVILETDATLNCVVSSRARIQERTVNNSVFYHAHISKSLNFKGLLCTRIHLVTKLDKLGSCVRLCDGSKLRNYTLE